MSAVASLAQEQHESVNTAPTTTFTLPLVGDDSPPTRTASPTPSFVTQLPLVATGALLEFEQERLTPAIGIQFGKGLQLKEILSRSDATRDAVLRDIALSVSLNGVGFFKAQDELKPEDLATLGLLLGQLSGGPHDSTLHIHPTQELGENGLPVGQITSQADKEGRQISFMEERSTLASSNWHTDVSFEPRPAAYTVLRMHTLPSLGGDTLFASAYAHYDLLSPAMAAFLSTLTVLHDAEIFREQSIKHNFTLRTLPRGAPENSGDAFQAVHPLIRTNPVTGLKGLYVNRTFSKRIMELSWDESDALLAYLFKIQHESHNAQVRYRWSTNDVAIWDNRSTTHAATFDYNEFRAGDRVVVVGEKPYFDPHSLGRKEAQI